MSIQPSEVLGAMITPAVLISAVALLLLSTTNRLSRVIDRIERCVVQLENRYGQAAQWTRHKRALTRTQLEHLLQRLLLLRAAVTGMYLTIVLLVLTSITAGLNLLIPQVVRLVPISLGFLATVSFLYCIVVLVREALVAVKATLDEIEEVRAYLEEPETEEGAASSIGREGTQAALP